MIIGMLGGQAPLRINLPTTYAGVIANGTSVAVTATADAFVTGGFPPYTHNWTDNIAAISAQASASVTTRIQATGTNVEHIGVLVYTVTQANGVATTASAAVDIIQGTP